MITKPQWSAWCRHGACANNARRRAEGPSSYLSPPSSLLSTRFATSLGGLKAASAAGRRASAAGRRGAWRRSRACRATIAERPRPTSSPSPRSPRRRSCRCGRSLAAAGRLGSAYAVTPAARVQLRVRQVVGQKRGARHVLAEVRQRQLAALGSASALAPLRSDVSIRVRATSRPQHGRGTHPCDHAAEFRRRGRGRYHRHWGTDNVARAESLQASRPPRNCPGNHVPPLHWGSKPPWGTHSPIGSFHMGSCNGSLYD